jgi:hypothetical protein
MAEKSLLSDLSEDELLALSSDEFCDSVEDAAKLLVPDALDTYADVMNQDDDHGARVKAADKILELAGARKQQIALPPGLSPEIFGLALAGLGQLAGIARGSTAEAQILRNVSPAKADPRLMPQELLAEKPKPSRAQDSSIDNEAIAEVIAHERFEIKNPEAQF